MRVVGVAGDDVLTGLPTARARLARVVAFLLALFFVSGAGLAQSRPAAGAMGQGPVLIGRLRGPSAVVALWCPRAQSTSLASNSFARVTAWSILTRILVSSRDLSGAA